ncbi:Acetylgalactosaminyl-O-glycosyl-glycoprotein beta-1,3-N-acetylglucosaminyltransferase [Holothuria leucospilota]|uniref:Acetylgalactosaminyl-O-glycosyl-glycoprotein beta-1,3-N-acetylglucosaminyltransferase n=1 Tax=Holothuria leucospilota TaxID=206669 RepID=A0A9Q0YLK7_HOLLE|nr:Acetylgalactosaminyl-O-glycosyl-glycoprotein beta-1,3-N-acetylglucosaminyltransferase [Holothuria leucospilota]
MGSPLRTIAISCMCFVNLITIGTVFVLISISPNLTTSPTVKLRQLQKVRSFFNFTKSEEHNEEQWKDWKKDIFMNDYLFSEAFVTFHSDKLLQKRNSQSSKVALCVLSSPSNFEMRDAARKTWANPSQMAVNQTAFWFILGKSNSSKENSEVLREKEKFGDIIVGNFTDSKDNDTLKLLFSLYFVITYYPSVKEIYFGFDSTYVHIQHLQKKLMFREDGGGIGQWRGYVLKGKKPERDKANPFYVSESVYNYSVYPTFCTLQNGFTLSSSLGKQILSIARNATLFVLPDIFIGMLAPRTRLEILEDKSFGSQFYRPNIKLCLVRSIMTTFTFKRDIVNSWKTLSNESLIRQCLKPDIDVVLPKMTDNGPYFNQVLKYLNNNEDICSAPSGSHGGTFIVALISSFVGNFEQRLAIRETWGSKDIFYSRIVRFVFVLGSPTANKNETQSKVDEEFRKYGDIIQGNFDESFQNLTLKVVLGLKWVTEFCSEAAYLYKGDEDMFVAWSRVVRLLLQKSDSNGSPVMKRFFFGRVQRDSLRINNPKSKYFVNESTYHGKFYPEYCSGGSYILSTDIIPKLYRMSLITPLIPIDDAYQGILTYQIGVSPIHHDGFKVSFRKRDCILQDPYTLTLHGFDTSAGLRKVWTRYILQKECLNDTHEVVD